MENLEKSPDLMVAELRRTEWGRIVAALVRRTGDPGAAEDAAAEAFAHALVRWREEGVPERPVGWLVAVASRRAIDGMRRRSRLGPLPESLAAEPAPEPETVPDERLRLFFQCCHPAIATEAQVALTLRLLGGLETAEIARAFYASEEAMARRIGRAKEKIRTAGVPFAVPGPHDLADRLDGVAATIYLTFTAGYAAAHDPDRASLCEEAIRLARALRSVLPEPSGEIDGLLALMLLHHARRAARFRDGDVVLLADQDRALWDGRAIAEAAPLVGSGGPYGLQAAIALAHAGPDGSDWRTIAALYDRLMAARPSPAVALNRAVARSFAIGPEAGLAAIDDLVAEGSLVEEPLLWSARAELLARLGRDEESARDLARAIGLTTDPADRRLLEGRYARSRWSERT